MMDFMLQMRNTATDTCDLLLPEVLELRPRLQLHVVRKLSDHTNCESAPMGRAPYRPAKKRGEHSFEWVKRVKKGDGTCAKRGYYQQLMLYSILE